MSLSKLDWLCGDTGTSAKPRKNSGRVQISFEGLTSIKKIKRGVSQVFFYFLLLLSMSFVFVPDYNPED